MDFPLQIKSAARPSGVEGDGQHLFSHRSLFVFVPDSGAWAALRARSARDRGIPERAQRGRICRESPCAQGVAAMMERQERTQNSVYAVDGRQADVRIAPGASSPGGASSDRGSWIVNARHSAPISTISTVRGSSCWPRRWWTEAMVGPGPADAPVRRCASCLGGVWGSGFADDHAAACGRPEGPPTVAIEGSWLSSRMVRAER